MSAIPWKNKEAGPADAESGPLIELRQEFERLFDNYLREPLAALGEGLRGEAGNVPVDLLENDQEWIIRADLPGVAPEDLQLSLCGNSVCIAGERKAAEDPNERLLRSERRVGAFRRNVDLPSPIDADQTSASFQHGVLTVRLKKSPQAATRRIHISGSNG